MIPAGHRRGPARRPLDPMRQIKWLVIAGVVAGAAVVAATWRPWPLARPAAADPQTMARRMLWFELQPVTLPGCTLERFGEPGDGGYLLCGNLLDGVATAYSYGISGYDGWGCEMATRRHVPVHQYDCFNLTRPACAAPTVFHEECVGGEPAVQDGRTFSTIERQFTENGDTTSRVVVKMDVEGAEWDAFLTAPDDVLGRIDQLVVEFHGTDERRFLTAVRRLKQYFHVANLHMNNHSCDAGLAPFPAWAYEVLLVNRRLAEAGREARPQPFHPLDRPNTTAIPDCQPTP
jgi:hypothetical protein